MATRKARPKSSRSFEPRSVEEFEENVAVLLYGKSGRGKTKTASTFPRPLLFLDINEEKGLKTVKGQKGVEFLEVSSWDDFEDIYWWLRKGQDFKSIVLDQITGLQDLCMKKAREKLRMDPGVPFRGFKAWGVLSGDMKTWLQSYRELKSLYNIIFIAHERVFGDEGDDEDEIDPNVSARVIPSIGDFVEGACDIIGHNYIRSFREKDKKTGKTQSRIEYCLRIGPHPIYTTKVRRPPELGRPPDFVVDPSYRKLMAIEAGVNTSTVERRTTNGKKQKGARKKVQKRNNR